MQSKGSESADEKLIEAAKSLTKQHEDMAKTLKQIKKQIAVSQESHSESPPSESSKEGDGWKILQDFFKGSAGAKKAKKLEKFLSLME